jgi:hypothetical protein
VGCLRPCGSAGRRRALDDASAAASARGRPQTAPISLPPCPVPCPTADWAPNDLPNLRLRLRLCSREADVTRIRRLGSVTRIRRLGSASACVSTHVSFASPRVSASSPRRPPLPCAALRLRPYTGPPLCAYPRATLRRLTGPRWSRLVLTAPLALHCYTGSHWSLHRSFSVRLSCYAGPHFRARVAVRADTGPHRPATPVLCPAPIHASAACTSPPHRRLRTRVLAPIHTIHALHAYIPHVHISAHTLHAPLRSRLPPHRRCALASRVARA